MADSRKTWTPAETRTLIQRYKEHPNLWNPDHADYKNRPSKRDSLVRIGNEFNVIPEEVERKLCSIASQYRRERRNFEKSQLSGGPSNFRPKWFGYNLMSFLHGKVFRRSQGGDDESFVKVRRASASEDEATQDNEDKEMEYDPLEENSILLVDYKPTNKNESRISQVQRAINDAYHVNATVPSSSVMGSIYKEERQDEYDVFGELVARKIRHLGTHYSRCTVQHLINNILYEAEIGKYDAAEPPPRTHPTYQTPSTSGLDVKHQ